MNVNIWKKKHDSDLSHTVRLKLAFAKITQGHVQRCLNTLLYF